MRVVIAGCRWPGCARQAIVAWWGCKDHWYRLPLALRLRLSSAFRPSQVDFPDTASTDWRKADADIREWIAAAEAPARMVA